MFSTTFLLTTLLICCVSNRHVNAAFSPDDTEECRVTRQDCVECIFRVCDYDGDGLIDGSEIDQTKHDKLVWYVRWAAPLAGQTTKRIMELCDYDKDGKISPQDVYDSYETCLATCGRKQMFFDHICKD